MHQETARGSPDKLQGDVVHCKVCVCGLGPLQQVQPGALPGSSGGEAGQDTGVGLQVLQDVVARGACRAGSSKCLPLLPAMPLTRHNCQVASRLWL